MTKNIKKILTHNELPKETSVVIIGGGIVGVSAALTLAENNIPVVLIEKGHVAGEQSSRNLGWIRKTSRHSDDVPLALAADKLWAGMSERVGHDLGYKQSGIMFLADTEEQMGVYEGWLDSVNGLGLDSHLLGEDKVNKLLGNSRRSWSGAIYTPSDGRAEPCIAAIKILEKAIERGVKVVQHCAVRDLIRSGGKVSGVITEKGEIRCEHAILAGGAWSRRFLGNLGVSLPTLPLICSVMRTKPMQGPTDIAVGASNFSFRKHQDGGFIITQRGALDAPICLDHLLIGHHYLGQLKHQRDVLRIKVGKHLINDLKMPRRWKEGKKSPFESVRTLNPAHNASLINEALTNLKNAYPMFENAEIEESWAGLIDVTPDSNPVIDKIEHIPGLVVATGFSGHGFGTGPAAGHLAADLVSGNQPIIDPTPYRFSRL
ncbi:FAD-binding oxidoreductase [Vibrio sp. Isolate31]|uniref:NAD(P)/FAD-dependent oxidoreductase n=1 Tax=unclassified Vibrio TaxID=2614977 RepID=UPI001EFD9FAB|nr:MULTISPECIES: FAD-binding oxidoreductase [unclassified Vibrio]MCG9554779.1 FAD-binding oxidoreductase [Vibrio sp. Isolate32]MCG9601003.1 FAD-binding oxidoreductase [Vibrio sp. Isolate31]